MCLKLGLIFLEAVCWQKKGLGNLTALPYSSTCFIPISKPNLMEISMKKTFNVWGVKVNVVNSTMPQ